MDSGLAIVLAAVITGVFNLFITLISVRRSSASTYSDSDRIAPAYGKTSHSNFKFVAITVAVIFCAMIVSYVLALIINFIFLQSNDVTLPLTVQILSFKYTTSLKWDSLDAAFVGTAVCALGFSIGINITKRGILFDKKRE